MMNKQPIKPFKLWTETVDALTREGLLLCTVGLDATTNVMTIGWMTAGVIWGRTIVTVLVRPSRHSFGLLEQVGEFTVNVLPPRFDEAVQYCGGTSGRDGDKFAHTNLTPAPAQKVGAPIIEQGVIHYECRVVHKNDVAPATLTPEIVAGAYPQGNFHRIYFGELVAVYAAADAREQLQNLSQ
jgi:flavin reductase (DIM6/NTAB) family NADH-FMN oxidoreductase RutF